MTAIRTRIPGAQLIAAYRAGAVGQAWDKNETCPCWPSCWVEPSGPVRLGRADEETTGGRR